MLDLDPIKQRLAEAKRQRTYEEADRHEAKNRAPPTRALSAQVHPKTPNTKNTRTKPRRKT